MQYAENDKKTDEKLYVSAINCPVQRAYEHMMTTKVHYGKLGGNVAYHGFQSFKENEVTPEECHSIGVETAKRMWGDEYEIVVTTHLDKHHHLHNHFVVNSVSFRRAESLKIIFQTTTSSVRFLTPSVRNVANPFLKMHPFTVVRKQPIGFISKASKHTEICSEKILKSVLPLQQAGMNSEEFFSLWDMRLITGDSLLKQRIGKEV